MSKNIVIQEGDIGRQFTADKLKTALVGGGSCCWVPEDEVNLSTLNVTENGTYNASDEGFYGYSQVNVNVPGGAGGPPGGKGSSIIGENPDTGENTLVQVDDSGTLESKILPDRIAITSLPSQLYYYEGQDIIYDGLVVKAYLKDGSLWTDETHPDGVIPISELTLPLEKAAITGDYETIWSDPNKRINAVEVTCNQIGRSYWSAVQFYYGGNIGSDSTAGTTGMCSLTNDNTTFLVTQYNDGIYVMTLYENDAKQWTMGGLMADGWRMRHSSFNGESAPVNKFGGRSINSNTYFSAYDLSNLPVSTIDPTGVEDIDLEAKHSTEQVPVQWMCDGIVAMEVSYEIDVEAWPYDTPINEG